MKLKQFMLFFVLVAMNNYAQTPLLQNSYLREGQTLNGTWNYIVDMYETGYYNYRWQPHDGSVNPGAGAFFTNAKPKNKMDLVEYNFDTAPTIMVPSDWNTQDEKLYFYEGSIWYKKSFDILNYNTSKRYYIHFGAVNYRADVYVNGKKLGMHKGGFTSFNYEMTDLVKATDNFVIVRVDNKRAADEVPTLNTDWWNYGGITRDVTIYELNETFIEDYSLQLKKGEAKQLSGYVQLNGNGANKTVVLSIPELKLKKEFTTNINGKVAFEFDVKRLEYWSDTNPKLYNVTLEAAGDKIDDKIGFRTIETKGSDVLLNGEVVFLKGISIHEENPMHGGGRAHSMEDARLLLSWAKELGCNFVRLAHYPHNENMVRLADEMGMLVWEENPVYWTIQWENPETYDKAEQQLSELISRDKNRASVIIWSMSNETPQSDARFEFLSNLAKTARQLDNTRLISAALETQTKSADNPNILTIHDRFAEVVDILSFNQYYGWYWGDINNMKNIRWEVDIDKPIIISEFGAGAQQGFHADELTRWSEEFQELLYKETLPTLAKIPQLSGITPWILSDFRSPRRMLVPIQNGWNRKGLISETGTKKKAFFALRDFYDNLELEGSRK